MEIGTTVNIEYVVDMAGVASPLGLQSGIFVNDDKKLTVLKMKDPHKAGQNYPNYWDKENIGILYFFGTNKGQTREQNRQNLNSRLNKHVDKNIFPIHVFVELENHQFMYMGEYRRIPRYDRWEILNEKYVMCFGLVSTDIKTSEKYIKSFLKRN